MFIKSKKIRLITVISAFVIINIFNFQIVINSDNNIEGLTLSALNNIATADEETIGDTSCWIENRRSRWNPVDECFYPCIDASNVPCCAENFNAC